jgi:hypothetical protein
MLEAIGNLIQNLSAEDSDPARSSLHSYYDVIIERFKDTNSYVRVKVVHVLTKLAK